MANFKEIPCPFCGRMVRDSDKFCIFCGSKLQKTESKYTAEERNEINKELSVTTAKSTSEELPEFQILNRFYLIILLHTEFQAYPELINVPPFALEALSLHLLPKWPYL